MYVYKQSEPNLWTVGYYWGQWVAESDHDTPQAAAERVRWLNGGSAQWRVELGEGLRTPDGHHSPCGRFMVWDDKGDSEPECRFALYRADRPDLDGDEQFIASYPTLKECQEEAGRTS